MVSASAFAEASDECVRASQAYHRLLEACGEPPEQAEIWALAREAERLAAAWDRLADLMKRVERG